MKAFSIRESIIFCLIATVSAGRLDQGYQYNNANGLQFTSSSNTGSAFLQDALQNSQLMQTLFASQSLPPSPPLSQQTFSLNSNAQPTQQFSNQGRGHYQTRQQYHPQNVPTITKDIYVHVPPAEQEEQNYNQLAHHNQQIPPRKHYRIVFIKAPSPPSNSAASLKIAPAPIEEKTIIYVLTKKSDPLQISAALQEAQIKPPSKPEVYFIKYKTQEEAQHAQRTIQAQFDSLGGTTQISDEGVAPLTSVIGSLDHQQNHNSKSTSGSGAIDIRSNTSNGGYLPPSSARN